MGPCHLRAARAARPLRRPLGHPRAVPQWPDGARPVAGRSVPGLFLVLVLVLVLVFVLAVVFLAVAFPGPFVLLSFLTRLVRCAPCRGRCGLGRGCGRWRCRLCCRAVGWTRR